MSKSRQILFNNRVVLVTGAGGGLGRAYALLFAERGAAVVVNDLGGGTSGGGASVKPADAVVNEIRSKGGKAVANYDSVEDGDKLVKTAIDNFGRLDIVINNAGILRDKSFANISDNDWDAIHRVHLRGSFLISRAAWPYMKKQKYGKIIMTSSASGLYGNFGQANYASAKLGVLGLCNALAKEGSRYNISCNTIVPTAGSRMTESVMPPEIHAALKPEYIAPVVAYLCHDSCTENGGVFEAAAGWAGKVRWQRAKGAVVRTTDRDMTPETVMEAWENVTDFTESTYLNSAEELVMELVKVLDTISDSPSQPIKPSVPDLPDNSIYVAAAKGFQFPDLVFEYSHRDCILFNLGVGVTTESEEYLRFLYEGHDKFSVFPSFFVLSAQEAITQDFPEHSGVNADITKVLHGEQYMEILKPLPTSGKLRNVATIVDVLDKGSGSVMVFDVNSFDDKNDLVLYNQIVVFIVGCSAIGGKKSGTTIKPTVETPSRAPDASITDKTSVNQAAWYRLSGDFNPLHIDPSFAAMGGFDKPILHGLCSLGFAVKHVIQQYADNDTSKFKALKVRFVKPVLPGQTLQTDMWKDGNRIMFTTKVVENGEVSLTSGYVDLHEIVLNKSTIVDPVATLTHGSVLEADRIFKEIAEKLKKAPEIADKIKASFLWNITKDGQMAGQWTADMKTEKCVYKGEPRQGKADCTVTVSDSDLAGLVTGKLNPQKLFFAGKLKLKGNIMLAQKMGQLFQQQAKL